MDRLRQFEDLVGEIEQFLILLVLLLDRLSLLVGNRLAFGVSSVLTGAWPNTRSLATADLAELGPHGAFEWMS